jgi:hypothetical protein
VPPGIVLEPIADPRLLSLTCREADIALRASIVSFHNHCR